MRMRDCRKFRMKIEFVANSKGSKVIGGISENRTMIPFDDTEEELKKQK